MRAPVGSVVIPAHNEAAVIRRGLDALLDGFEPGELEVAVVCNGCTDGTAALVRAAGYPVKVIELAAAGKPAALRAGDDGATVFPRLYLDADVVLAPGSARRVLARLREGPVLAARPPARYDTSGAGPLVRGYYRARTRVPAAGGALWGAGVYGLSAAGRARFAAFPDVIADDLFVGQLFDDCEVEIVNTAPVLVRTPRTAGALLRVLRRVSQGNAEHHALTPAARRTTASTVRGLLKAAAAKPAMAPDVAVYLAVTMAARMSCRLAPPAAWATDASSRRD